MKIIVLDGTGLFDAAFRDAAHERSIEVIVETRVADAVKTFVRHPEADAALVLVPAANHGVDIGAVPQLRRVDPTLPVLAVFADPAELAADREELLALGAYCVPLAEGPNSALSALEQRLLVAGRKRSQHRVDLRLRALLFEHDGMDAKLPGSGKFVEVISLSAQGAYVAASRYEAEQGQSYLFEIQFEDFIFLVKGRAVWVNNDSSTAGRPRGFALRFEEMSRAPQGLIRHLVEEDLIDSILRGQGGI